MIYIFASAQALMSGLTAHFGSIAERQRSVEPVLYARGMLVTLFKRQSGQFSVRPGQTRKSFNQRVTRDAVRTHRLYAITIWSSVSCGIRSLTSKIRSIPLRAAISIWVKRAVIGDNSSVVRAPVAIDATFAVYDDATMVAIVAKDS
jgi:hypothetical protein